MGVMWRISCWSLLLEAFLYLEKENMCCPDSRGLSSPNTSEGYAVIPVLIPTPLPYVQYKCKIAGFQLCWSFPIYYSLVIIFTCSLMWFKPAKWNPQPIGIHILQFHMNCYFFRFALWLLAEEWIQKHPETIPLEAPPKQAAWKLSSFKLKELT